MLLLIKCLRLRFVRINRNRLRLSLLALRSRQHATHPLFAQLGIQVLNQYLHEKKKIFFFGELIPVYFKLGVRHGPHHHRRLPQADSEPFPADADGHLSRAPAGAGHSPKVEAKDKPTVIALREIAAGKVGIEMLKKVPR